MSELDVRTLAVGGRTLRVGTSPSRPGSVPLLFFNGIGANLDLVRGFADEIGRFGIGIVIFDVPGTGGSSPPPVPYRLRSLAALAANVLAAVGIDGQVDVGGVSWGGGLAQEFAHQYPKRVRRLVLAATTAGSVAIPGRLSALAKLLSPRRYAEPAFMARIAGDLYGGKFRNNPDLIAKYAVQLRAPHGSGYYFQLLAGLGWTSALWLRRLRQPALVMVGADDPIVPAANGRILAGLLPNARLVTIDDGHLFLVTSAPESAAIVAEFLTSDEPARTHAAPAAANR
jgi:poly(3-hydroxyalkanoate) depolymerase